MLLENVREYFRVMDDKFETRIDGLCLIMSGEQNANAMNPSADIEEHSKLVISSICSLLGEESQAVQKAFASQGINF